MLVEGEAHATIEAHATVAQLVVRRFHLQPDRHVGFGEEVPEDAFTVLHAAQGGDDGQVLDVAHAFKVPPKQDADKDIVIHHDIKMVDRSEHDTAMRVQPPTFVNGEGFFVEPPGTSKVRVAGVSQSNTFHCVESGGSSCLPYETSSAMAIGLFHVLNEGTVD